MREEINCKGVEPTMKKKEREKNEHRAEQDENVSVHPKH